MKTRIMFLAATAAALLSQNVLACGDSLYRVGKGTPYRTYTTPLPGNLLVMATSAEAIALAHMLADSGHSITLVDDPAELTDAVRSGAHEVVIAPFADKAHVTAAGDTGTSFLPVAMSRQEQKAARQEFKTVLSNEDDIKKFLKTIHKTLKSRA